MRKEYADIISLKPTSHGRGGFATRPCISVQVALPQLLENRLVIKLKRLAEPYTPTVRAGLIGLAAANHGHRLP